MISAASAPFCARAHRASKAGSWAVRRKGAKGRRAPRRNRAVAQGPRAAQRGAADDGRTAQRGRRFPARWFVFRGLRGDLSPPRRAANAAGLAAPTIAAATCKSSLPD
jgi:hypothetical protein